MSTRFARNLEPSPARLKKKNGGYMALTRNFMQTVIGRDPEFAKALLDEAVTLFPNDKPEMPRLILRDLVNTAIGLSNFAETAPECPKSLRVA